MHKRRRISNLIHMTNKQHLFQILNQNFALENESSEQELMRDLVDKLNESQVIYSEEEIVDALDTFEGRSPALSKLRTFLSV